MFTTNYRQAAQITTQNIPCAARKMSTADKIFAQSVTKRQLLVIKDLMSLDKTYPGLIDKDLLGGLYSLYTLLEDNVNSITGRN